MHLKTFIKISSPQTDVVSQKLSVWKSESYLFWSTHHQTKSEQDTLSYSSTGSYYRWIKRSWEPTINIGTFNRHTSSKYPIDGPRPLSGLLQAVFFPLITRNLKRTWQQSILSKLAAMELTLGLFSVKPITQEELLTLLGPATLEIKLKAGVYQEPSFQKWRSLFT